MLVLDHRSEVVPLLHRDRIERSVRTLHEDVVGRILQNTTLFRSFEPGSWNGVWSFKFGKQLVWYWQLKKSVVLSSVLARPHFHEPRLVFDCVFPSVNAVLLSASFLALFPPKLTSGAELRHRIDVVRSFKILQIVFTLNANLKFKIFKLCIKLEYLHKLVRVWELI